MREVFPTPSLSRRDDVSEGPESFAAADEEIGVLPFSKSRCLIS